ncbi:MAG TPA: hypothetical protein VJK51_04350 [Candidatus Nanoarchaeia archaeon]|nr:hypothetical protein [Candidatus Nanoarchaeia archaeon]
MNERDAQNDSKITTIKLSQHTKQRIEKFRSYRRETYEEILDTMLEILSVCKMNPDRARSMLLGLDIKHKKAEKPSKDKEKKDESGK